MMPSLGNKSGFDSYNFQKKVSKLIKELGPEIAVSVAWGSTELRNAVNKNLNGTEYFPGKLPVRAISHTLRRAYRVKKINPYAMYHFIDQDVADYAKWVHYGTKRMAPRPFFSAAVNERGPAIANYWNRQIKKKMRSIGLS